MGGLPRVTISLYPQAPIFQTSKIHSCFFLKSEKSRVQLLLFFPRDCRHCSATTLLFLQTKKNRVIRFQPTVPRSLWKGAEAICYCTVAPSSSLKVGALATDAYGHESALKPLVLSERQLLYQLRK